VEAKLIYTTNGTGAAITIMDPGSATHQQRFYRVEAKPVGAK